jgi:hypothetical protein
VKQEGQVSACPKLREMHTVIHILRQVTVIMTAPSSHVAEAACFWGANPISSKLKTDAEPFGMDSMYLVSFLAVKRR